MLQVQDDWLLQVLAGFCTQHSPSEEAEVHFFWLFYAHHWAVCYIGQGLSVQIQRQGWGHIPFFFVGRGGSSSTGMEVLKQFVLSWSCWS